MSTPFHISNAHHDLIRGDVHLPEHIDGAPVLIICHGFKGFKDWGGFPRAADYFAGEGFVTVRFNFSLNGVEEDFMEFTALDRFARNTISREVEDVRTLIDALIDGTLLPPGCDVSRIGLIGHSLGGGVAIVQANEDERVSAVTTWAAVADFMRWGKKTRDLWREKGRLEIENARTGQIMPVDIRMLEDLENNADRFNIPNAAAKLHRPLLIIHGEQDVSVPLDEARRISAAADPAHTVLHVLPNSDHTFGVRHPFEGETAAFRQVLELSSEYFRRVLTTS